MKEALMEKVYLKLDIIKEDIAKERDEENGWKALRRSERERILKILNLLGLDFNNLVELIQD